MQANDRGLEFHMQHIKNFLDHVEPGFFAGPGIRLKELGIVLLVGHCACSGSLAVC